MTSPPPATAAVAGEAAAGPDARRGLWICWWIFPVFYTLFGLIFVPLTRVMPPPRPGMTVPEIVTFFGAHRLGIQIGFGLLMVVIGGGSIVNGLVAHQMRRMTVSPVFAYAYIATLAVGAIPGCLFAAFSFLTATFRPDRDPHIVALLYDTGLLTFVGSLGCFATQYLILAIAILLDRKKVFPNWFAYVSVWQVVTELLAAPVFVFRRGPFAWNGVISFWEGTALFGVYIACLIMLLRKAIAAPDGPAAGPARSAAPARGLPGDPDMWVFVLGDLVIFSVYFIVYLVYRGHEPGVFLAAQRHLSLLAGAVNTLVLLASSRFVAHAMRAARDGDAARALRRVACGGACGLVFAAVKAGEWCWLVSHGLTVTRDDFFMFYFALTGVHLFHVLLGVLILGIAARELRNPWLRRVRVVEACAVYWHMVDLLWVILFALLYVMR